MIVPTRPLITIAITCFNARDTIRRAVTSAVEQTWPRREILVLDDFSTDGSWRVVQDLVREFPEVRAVRHDHNRGYPAALNSLIGLARGELIAFFDDDDHSEAHRVECQHQRITQYESARGNSVILCYSNRLVVRNGETKPDFQRLAIGRTPPEPSGAVVADYILKIAAKNDRYCWGMFGSCTLMARAASLRGIGSFDERFRRSAELDFAVRAAFKGAHFVSVDAPLVTQYLTDTPDKAENVALRYLLLLLRKHKDYLASRRAYRGAVANARAGFHHGRRRHWRGRAWRAFALMLFPWRISWEWFASRCKHRTGVTKRLAADGQMTSHPTSRPK